jgi:hypothetical protein
MARKNLSRWLNTAAICSTTSVDLLRSIGRPPSFRMNHPRGPQKRASFIMNPYGHRVRIPLANPASNPTGSSQLEVCGATIMTNLGEVGQHPTTFHPTSPSDQFQKRCRSPYSGLRDGAITCSRSSTYSSPELGSTSHPAPTLPLLRVPGFSPWNAMFVNGAGWGRAWGYDTRRQAGTISSALGFASAGLGPATGRNSGFDSTSRASCGAGPSSLESKNSPPRRNRRFWPGNPVSTLSFLAEVLASSSTSLTAWPVNRKLFSYLGLWSPL